MTEPRGPLFVDLYEAMTNKEAYKEVTLHPLTTHAAWVLVNQQEVWDMIDLPNAERLMLTLLFCGFTSPFDRTYKDGSTGTFDAKKMSWVVTDADE